MTTTKQSGSAAAEITDRALAIIREHKSIHEGRLLGLIFPPPVYPVGSGQAAKDAWRGYYDQWKDQAYSSEQIPYCDCHAGRLSAACIELARAGLIRTHNNGFNSYTYEAVKK